MTRRIGIDPCTPLEALARMQALADSKLGEYQLGTGNFNPKGFAKKYDCAGAICEAYMLTRHRPGFADGRVPVEYRDQSDVDDDINTNSMIEDALTKRELFEPVLEGPLQPGDLVLWATLAFRIDGEVKRFIGHVLMVKSIHAGWTMADGFTPLRFLQCHGPNGRKPAVVETDGSSIDRHNAVWPKPAHRAMVIRVKSAA